MLKFEQRQTDDDYMYKFRTKLCTKKRCRNPPKCFDAHSEVMRRRVPVQGEHGLYNYLPKPCPEWQKLKKCSLGEGCPRSHGWLEIIFHPLLYKTKMCKSDMKDGVCREYGIYCAKAHKPREIRNLVRIYGESWKKHYDLSLRGKGDTLSPVKTRGRWLKKSYRTQSKRQSAGFFFTENVPDKPNGPCSTHAGRRGSTKTSTTLVNSKTVIDPESPIIFTSPPLFADYTRLCESMPDLSLDGGVTSYTQPYSKKVSIVENSYNSPIPKLPWDCIWYSLETDVPVESSYASLSNSIIKNMKKCNVSYVDWKIDDKVSEWDKEKPDSTKSWDAHPPYEGQLEQEFFFDSGM